MSSAVAVVRPLQGFYLRPTATFDRVGPLVPAGTRVSIDRLEPTRMTRGGTGKALLLARVTVAEGALSNRMGFAALALADLRCAHPESPTAVALVEAERAKFADIVAELERAAGAPSGEHPPAADEDGLVVDGRIVPIEGLEVLSYLRHPKLVPQVKDGRPRVEPVLSFVVHTVHGKVGRVVEAPAPPSTRAERYARYQATTSRDVSWHLTLDTDRTLLVSADLARRLCWHAPPTNNWSIGLELVQDNDGTLYGPQLDAAVQVIARCCDLFGIPRRVPVEADGRPYQKAVPAWRPRAEGGRAERWAGVLAHRNVTGNRGLGDAGDGVMLRLLAAGFAPFRPPAT